MQLVIIGGAQRSGTTLLQTVLANALGSPNLPEAHILCDILTGYKRAKEFGNKTRVIYPNDAELLAFFRSFAERHVSDVAGGKQLNTLVLKDPNFIHTLTEATAVFPHCVRVVCVRDPRDIVASFVQIGQREIAAKPSKYKKRDINEICRKVLLSYQPLSPTMPEGVALVRYETFVSDTRGSLAALSRETGLKLSLDRIESGEWLDAKVRHEPTWITELEGGAPSAASIGSFKRVLTREEVAIVQKTCRPILEQFGYPRVENPNPGRRDKLRIFIGLRPRGEKTS